MYYVCKFVRVCYCHKILKSRLINLVKSVLNYQNTVLPVECTLCICSNTQLMRLLYVLQYGKMACISTISQFLNMGQKIKKGHTKLQYVIKKNLKRFKEALKQEDRAFVCPRFEATMTKNG